MQIAITGASGFRGQQLVPRLLARGVSLLLIGRDPAALRRRFPGVAAIGYQEIAASAQGFDLLLHLAALNSNQDASAEQFTEVNVDLAVESCRQARMAGIKRFIYVSSVHALDQGHGSSYVESKRAAVRNLERIEGIDVRVFYLPAILGDRLIGRLSPLNRLPPALRSIAESSLSAFKPTVHADKVVDAVLAWGGDAVPHEKLAIVSDGQDRNLTFRVVKRLQDIAAAFAIILLVWWAMLAIWLAIRLQSPGPGFLRQARVGRNGKVFTCYKFRTMYVATPNVGTHEVAASSVTGLGGVLRRYKLDELPQVVNILLNQMSLVGPRPCLPGQAELISLRRAKGVLEVKPGITGLAQVNGIDMSRPDVLAEWDQRYLQLQSILLDIKIIVQTVLGKGGGDKVRQP